jgi:hypothetical protein
VARVAVYYFSAFLGLQKVAAVVVFMKLDSGVARVFGACCSST